MTICCGIKDKIYELGGHTHFTICNKCKQYEENDKDTLYEMWNNDNITDDFKYADWEKEEKYKKLVFYNKYFKFIIFTNKNIYLKIVVHVWNDHIMIIIIL